ncbi:hypothetical protein BANORC5_33470 [Bacteroides nordii]|nr:hypothetical protein BANORC5_33470 [Bacteroides nordii]
MLTVLNEYLPFFITTLFEIRSKNMSDDLENCIKKWMATLKKRLIYHISITILEIATHIITLLPINRLYFLFA